MEDQERNGEKLLVSHKQLEAANLLIKEVINTLIYLS
jgi:hypothetical protein